MSKEKIEMKLEERILKVEKLSKACADILVNITDEGSKITDSKEDKVITDLSGKLDFVINTLTEMKKDVAYIELVERNSLQCSKPNRKRSSDSFIRFSYS